MLWFILGLGIFVALCVWINYRAWLELSEAFILFLIVGILSFILFFGASIIATEEADLEYKTIRETKIVALKDNQNADGRFFVGSGYIDEELYYYYATETEFGIKTDKLRADNCYIKYTDGEAYIETQDGEFTNEFIKTIATPLCPVRYIIHCPEDTVTNEFKVDLE